MISEVVMPQMGADMTEGTIVRWLKHEGDPVTRGEIIAEIETDKANVEIEAFESGVFRKALATEGDVIPVGNTIAIIAGEEDDISKYERAVPSPPSAGEQNREPSEPARTEPTAARTQTAPPVESGPPLGQPFAERPSVPSQQASGAEQQEPVRTGTRAAESSNGARERLRVSPVARRVAEERGIDLSRVHGTGPDGRIIRRDVEAAAAGASQKPAAAEAGPAATAPAATAPAAASTGMAMSKMRQAIARRMSESKREAPHYYLILDVDMTDALAFRQQANASLEEDQRLSINDIIVKAVAVALQRNPTFNVTLREGEQPQQHDDQNVCIGIALDEGLIAPALLDVGRKPLSQIAREAKDLIARSKGGALRAEEINNGTFTISNLGAYGVEALIAIIQPPQTAILGVGAVAPQAAVRDDKIVVRQMMKVALSADHRVTDGAQGARFLADLKKLLEQPLLLVL